MEKSIARPIVTGVWVVHSPDSVYGVYRTAEDAVDAYGELGSYTIRFVKYGERIL